MKEIEINGLNKKQTLEKFKREENKKSLFEKYKNGKNKHTKTKGGNT